MSREGRINDLFAVVRISTTKLNASDLTEAHKEGTAVCSLQCMQEGIKHLSCVMGRHNSRSFPFQFYGRYGFWILSFQFWFRALLEFSSKSGLTGFHCIAHPYCTKL